MNIKNIGNRSLIQNKKEQKPKNNFVLSLGAATTAVSASQTLKIADIALVRAMRDKMPPVTEEQNEVFLNTANKVMKQLTNLEDTGLTIRDYKWSKPADLKGLKNFINSLNMEQSIINGENAFYYPQVNEIHINTKKASSLMLHELGHAENNVSSKFAKFVNKNIVTLHYAPILLALLPAFMKEEKAKDGEELTKAQKAKNAFRKTSPLLAGGMLALNIVEENMANKRAEKWTKDLLNDNLFKRVCKQNKLGLASYIIGAFITVGAGYLGLKIKDKSVEKQENQFKQSV